MRGQVNAIWTVHLHDNTEAQKAEAWQAEAQDQPKS